MVPFFQPLEARRLLSDNALRFDGVNDFVDMGNPADDHLDLGTNATIEMKVFVRRCCRNRSALVTSGTS